MMLRVSIASSSIHTLRVCVLLIENPGGGCVVWEQTPLRRLEEAEQRARQQFDSMREQLREAEDRALRRLAAARTKQCAQVARHGELLDTARRVAARVAQEDPLAAQVTASGACGRCGEVGAARAYTFTHLHACSVCGSLTYPATHFYSQYSTAF